MTTEKKTPYQMAQRLKKRAKELQERAESMAMGADDLRSDAQLMESYAEEISGFAGELIEKLERGDNRDHANQLLDTVRYGLDGIITKILDHTDV